MTSMTAGQSEVASEEAATPAIAAAESAVTASLVSASASASVALEAPRINALQKFWLREIGIEKTWLKAPEIPPAASLAAEIDVSVGTGAETSDAAQVVQSRAARYAGLATAGNTAASASPAGSVGAAQPQGGATQAASNPPLPRDGATKSAANVSQPVSESAGQAARAARPSPSSAGATPVARAATPAAEPVVAATDFDALREQVQQCSACGLCQGRRHAVFGMGARPARWMVVGEAPGEQEDRQGLPFVGRSGQLLDAMLAAVGMSREKDVFIANVIKCRPPGNRNPKPEEIAACSPYLKRQIELVRPERILVLGRFAAQTLLGTDATIGSLRGRHHVWTSDDGLQIPVVVSYHPAYLLRSPAEKARAWQDLQLAATLS